MREHAREQRRDAAQADQVGGGAELAQVASPQQPVDGARGGLLDLFGEAQVGLRERANDRLDELSGGNRQRVNVAIGLIADPPVLALDEPSASLDPGQRERLWEFIRARSSSGTSVVFSTHTLGEVQRNASRVLVLDQGELLFDGAPEALMGQAGEGAPQHGGDLEHALVAFLEHLGR